MMIRHTVEKQLETSALQYGSKTALSFPEESLDLSFTELKERADLGARALLGMGLSRGDHIGIWSTNSSNWVSLALGAAEIGVVFIPMNTCYHSKELVEICSLVDAQAIFIMSPKDDAQSEELARALTPTAAGLEKLQSVYLLNSEKIGPFLGWDSFIEHASSVSDDQLRKAISKVDIDDTYIIQYTSGTTAKPKGAMLRQYGVLNTAKDYAALLHLSTSDITLVPLPLFHCFGNVLTLLGGLISGSRTVYMGGFSARRCLELMKNELCTCFMGVPTMYAAIMARPEFDESRFALQKAGIGGAYCPPAMAEAITRRFKIPSLIIGYGLSEAASLCTLSDIYDSEENRLGTVGRPLPGLEVSLFDSVSGRESAELESGEIVVRGFGVMTGYYKNPEATAKTIDADGWLHTGDLGRRTAQGYFIVTGRIKDIIIRGGENISPTEIEGVIMKMPDVHDCQCVGVPDPVMGEEIAAFIIPQSGAHISEAAVKAFVAEHLAKYKTPRYVLLTERFPVNAAGKIVKRQLTQIAIEKLTAQHKISKGDSYEQKDQH